MENIKKYLLFQGNYIVMKKIIKRELEKKL